MFETKSDMGSDAELNNYSLQSNIEPKNMQELSSYAQNILQNVQDKFQTMSEQIFLRIDEMGNRIDSVEKNITDLMNQAGVECPDN